MRTFRLLGMILIAIFICINLAACSDGNEEDDLKPNPGETSTITIDSNIITNGLVFAAEGSVKSVSFTTNADWTLNIASTTGGLTWCTASVTSGKKGEALVEFTTLNNSDYDDRSVSVTIKAGKASQTFTITQKYKEAILVTADKFEIDQKGGSINVEVKSNIDYQMEISETAKSWITETNTRALTTHNHTFSIAANEEYEKREGEIYFKKGEHVETVRVYQAGGALVMLTKEEYVVSDKGETITVEIKSNVEYGIKMPQVDWIYDEASTLGASSHTLKYVISLNETNNSRSAQIIYYDKKDATNTDTLTITQMQKGAIIIANNEYTIGTKGGVIEVKLNSSLDYTVSIADNGKNWISYRENTGSLVTNKMNFKIAENASGNIRTSHITFASNGISQDIKITQQGTGTIYLATAGTLFSFIDSSIKDKITRLKIIGNLNAADIEFLRNMKNIQVLDLSEVNIISIGKGAFEKCSSLTSIDIPNSVTSIGDAAFAYCSNLTSINIGNNVTNIGSHVFFSCRKLASVTIGNSVTKIGNFAFAHCTDLTSVTIGHSVKFIGKSVFYYCSSLTSITIPNSVTSIEYNTFKGCSGLVYVTIGNNITSIEDYAFSDCSNLVSVTIPNSVTNIGICAFEGCSNLQSVSIGNSVGKIGRFAFIDCTNLTSINVDEDNSNFSSIDGVLYDKNRTALIQCPQRKTVITIPNSVTSIRFSAFSSCLSLTSIAIPNSVTSIGEHSFYNCLSLTSITIPNNVTSIEESTFSHCSSLTSVTIPNSITSIGSFAFWNCSSLTSINIPDGTTRIYGMAFSGCLGLTSVTIPSSVTYTGYDIFESCSNITEIHIKHEFPRSINPSIFSDINKEHCILYVPKGCKNAYSAATGWKEFKNIMEE